jgi:hypothetical protein
MPKKSTIDSLKLLFEEGGGNVYVCVCVCVRVSPIIRGPGAPQFTSKSAFLGRNTEISFWKFAPIVR